MTLEERVLRHRLTVIQRAAALCNVSQACLEFGISAPHGDTFHMNPAHAAITGYGPQRPAFHPAHRAFTRHHALLPRL